MPGSILIPQVATFMQLITCGTLFYATELWGHYDTGVEEVWREHYCF